MTTVLPFSRPTRQASNPGQIVLKLGGELLEAPVDVARMARGIAALGRKARLVVVHGGGKEIDRRIARAGIRTVQVDGLRVTDAATLDVVVAALAGTLNTRLVAAVRTAGARPVGLTGADAGVVVLRRAAPHRTSAGRAVSLGLVGAPVHRGEPSLLQGLLADGYVPVVACIGADSHGQLLNVNADTLASHLAVALGADRLIIAGGTTGVLDADGRTIEHLDRREAARLIRIGTANAGMVAKLQACRAALRGGVSDVYIVNGRRAKFAGLAAADGRLAAGVGTQVVT